MLKNILLVFSSIFVLNVFYSCKTEAEKQKETQQIIETALTTFQKNLYQNRLDSILSKNTFNASVLVSRNGEILYQKNNGFENFSTKKPIDNLSVFAIASLSKQFTAVLVLLQEEQRKLTMKDRVSVYLSDFQNKEKEDITIEQLLNHTSGLNDFGEKLLSAPGKEFNYSNKGYFYLGKIIEKVSGKSFDANADELFKKLKMGNTTTAVLYHGKNFAGAYTGNIKNPVETQEMPKRLSEKDISVPAGGILSNVTDLGIWNDALYGNLILKPESLRKMLKKTSSREHPVLGKVGYGFGIMMNENSPKSYFHSGYIKGAPSLLIYYPETKTTVVILSNFADESKGKEPIFIPHQEIKEISDAIEWNIAITKKKLIKNPNII